MHARVEMRLRGVEADDIVLCRRSASLSPIILLSSARHLSVLIDTRDKSADSLCLKTDTFHVKVGLFAN